MNGNWMFQRFLDNRGIGYREIRNQIAFPVEVQNGKSLMMLYSFDDEDNSSNLQAFVPCDFRYKFSEGYKLCNELNANSSGPRYVVIDDVAGGNLYGSISVQLQDYLNPNKFESLCEEMIDREIDAINAVVEAVE